MPLQLLGHMKAKDFLSDSGGVKNKSLSSFHKLFKNMLYVSYSINFRPISLYVGIKNMEIIDIVTFGIYSFYLLTGVYTCKLFKI